MSQDRRSAITTRLLDGLALDDGRLAELAGPSTLSSGEIASLRRSAAVRRVLRRVPFLRDVARNAYRAVRGARGDAR